MQFHAIGHAGTCDHGVGILVTEPGSGRADQHGAAGQPVLISVEEGNPNSAQIFFYVGGALPADWSQLSDLARVALLFDGRDAQALASARAAWKDAKAAGHDVTYWKETPNGKFEKQN